MRKRRRRTRTDSSSTTLTDDVELDDVTLLRVGRDLALVLAFVARLDVLHLQRPRVRLPENRLEPFIRYEHSPVHREDMRVPSSDPGDLGELVETTGHPE